MGFSTHLLQLATCFTHLFLTWTKADRPELACADLDEWVRVSMTTAPRDYADIPLTFSLSTTEYTIGERLKVNIVGSRPFVGVMIQGRSVGQATNPPIGNWAYDDTIQAISCQQVMPHDTAFYRQRTAVNHVTTSWMALDNYGPVKFVSMILTSDGNIWSNSSEVLRPAQMTSHYHHLLDDVNHSHARLKRNVQDADSNTSTVVPSSDNITMPNDFTTENATTISTPPGFDFETFFSYFMIAGAYVGMYTVFSLVIM